MRAVCRLTALHRYRTCLPWIRLENTGNCVVRSEAEPVLWSENLHLMKEAQQCIATDSSQDA
jgi:hypothetical protein